MKKSLFLILPLLIAGVLRADEKTVSKVTVQAIDGFQADVSDVISYCNVQQGQEVSQTALSKDVRALLDTGRFSYASVDVLPTPNGVEVTYKVKRRYRFQGPLAIQGCDYFSESKIAKFADLKDGDPIDELVLADKAATIRKEYVKKYFPFPRIGVAMTDVDPTNGIAGVSFTIEEGPRAKHKSYEFTGNEHIDSKTLRATFGSRPWWDPRGWFADTPVSEQELDDARVEIANLYRQQGYLDATVGEARLEQVDKDHASIYYDIVEGPCYTIDSVAVEGVELFPETQVTEALSLAQGQLASSATVDAAAKTIRDFYAARGYVETQVRTDYEAVEGATNRVALLFTVQESEQVTIRNIVLRGNTKTKDKVLRRELLVIPGLVANDVLAERSENRLKNLNYFSTVRHYYVPTGEKGERDLVFDVEEQRTGNFMIGVGFSSIDSVVGYFEIRQSNFDLFNWPNFTGGGQKARLGVEYGDRRQTVETQWTEPWLFNRPLALNVELYRRMRWFDQYDEIRTGGGVGISYPIALGRLGLMHTLEYIDYDDEDDGPYFLDPDQNKPFAYGTSDDKGLSSRSRIYWHLDRRNRAFVPTAGYRINIFAEGQGDVTGSEWNTYALGVNYTHWVTCPFKTVLMWRLRYETVDAYGSTDEVPLHARYFIGGGRTVRGFEYRGLGPKLYNGDGRKTDDPYGGQTMAVATLEYTIPLFEAVRFAIFTDIGCLGADFGDPDFDNIYATVGCGLRIDIPGFPIRLDVAVPYSNPDDSEEEVFSFWIGFD